MPGYPREDILDLLSALADKSFVQVLLVPGAPPRYQMLETIRAYAAAALEAAGETAEMHRARARYFLAQAEAAEPPCAPPASSAGCAGWKPSRTTYPPSCAGPLTAATPRPRYG